MQVQRFLLPLLVASSLLASCNTSHWNRSIQGQGPMEGSQRELATFDRISLSGGMQLDVIVGGPQSVLVHANGNLQEYIRTRIEGTTLKIDFSESVTCSGNLRATISVPELVGVSISGSSRLDVDGISSDDFYLDVSGSVRADLQGQAKSLDVDISGSGRLEAYEMQSELVDIDVSGSGRLEVNATRNLDVSVSGSANVTYRGRPNVNISQSGSARVQAEKPQAL